MGMAYSLKLRACQLWLHCGLLLYLNWACIVLSRPVNNNDQAQFRGGYSLGPSAEKAKNAPVIVSLKRRNFSRSLLGYDAHSTKRINTLPHKRNSLRPHNYSFIEIFGSVREAGYYYAEFQLGTPPQDFELIVDTGSTITYVPCSDCTHCGQHTNDLFQPSNSSTFRIVGCQEKLCAGKVCTEGTCAYFRHYAENSSSRGSLVEDVLALKNPDIQNPPARIVFGCENLESGDLYAQTADGIMGLGNADIAIHNQLMETQGLSNTFGLCFGGFDGGGSLILGDFALPSSSDEPREVIYTPMVEDSKHPTYYKVYIDSMTLGTDLLSLEDVHFGIKKEKGNYLEKKWQDLGYGIVLDSGTTFSYLPEPLFTTFVASFKKQVSHLQQVAGPDPNFNDLCYESSSNMLDTHFPVLHVNFRPFQNSSSGAVLELHPKNYLFMHDDQTNAYCLGFFNNGYAGTLLGGITFRDILVIYELNKKRIGFLSPFDCGSLSKLSTHLDIKNDPISDRTRSTGLLRPLSDSPVQNSIAASEERCTELSPAEVTCPADATMFNSPRIDKFCTSGCQLDVNVLFNQSNIIQSHTFLRLKECFGLEELATSESKIKVQNQMVVSGRVYDPHTAKKALVESFCSQRNGFRKLFSSSNAMVLTEPQYFPSDCHGLLADILGIVVHVCPKSKYRPAREGNFSKAESDRLYRSTLSDAVISVDAFRTLTLDRIMKCAIPFLALAGVAITWLFRSKRHLVSRAFRPSADSECFGRLQ